MTTSLSSLDIREETASDIPAVRKVVTAAFAQTVESDLVDALRVSGDSILSLVAVNGGEISGHILFSKLQAPDKCLALAPVAVFPDSQKKGIGSKLIVERLAQVKRNGWEAVFLLGEPEFYQRFGFSTDIANKFETPYPKQYFMALELAPDALKERSGEIIYAPPFLMLE